MAKIKIFILFFISLFFAQLQAGIDPFSKIKITSEKAICKKSINLKDVYIFNYIGNVVVTLADSSKITSNSLEIELDGKNIKVFGKNKNSSEKKVRHQNKSDKKPSQVKKIMFKNNVQIFSKNRQASSNMAEINMPENTCKLEGNVKIIQTKTNQKKDIPLNIQSNSALINLKTSEITLLGNSSEPVSTVVELGNGILSSNRKKSANE